MVKTNFPIWARSSLMRYPEVSKPCIPISRDQDLFLLDLWKFRNFNPLNSIFFEIFIFENKIDLHLQVIFLVKTSVIDNNLLCMLIFENLPPKMTLFLCQRILFYKYDVRNGCRNKFEDHNEKLCSWFRNRYSLKIDFANVWTHESISTAEELSVAQGFLIRRFFQNDFKVFRINDQKS